MGPVLGLVFGLGLLLVWRGGPRRPAPAGRPRPDRVAELLAQAGYAGIRPRQLYLVCVVTGALVAGIVGAVSRTGSLALAFGAFAAWSPVALVKARRRQRVVELRDV